MFFKSIQLGRFKSI